MKCFTDTSSVVSNSSSGVGSSDLRAELSVSRRLFFAGTEELCPTLLFLSLGRIFVMYLLRFGKTVGTARSFNRDITWHEGFLSVHAVHKVFHDEPAEVLKK